MKAGVRYHLRAIFLTGYLIMAGLPASSSEQPVVRIEPSDSVGPRELEQQTATAVIRDYLAAWTSLGRAFEENRPDLLNAYFVGIAAEKLTGTIQEQQKLAIQTRYQPGKHDISLVFYSPEGLSIQLLDTVEYDVQVLDHEKLQAAQHVHARYVAVLTPTEVRWKVRIFQADPIQ